MNAKEKQAWLMMACFSASAIGFTALLPSLGPEHACGAFGLMGLAALGPMLFRPFKCDERDRAINRKAALLAFLLSYLTFAAGCMGTWMVVYGLHGKEQISIHALAAIAAAGGIVCYVAHSLSLLILYHGRLETDHG